MEFPFFVLQFWISPLFLPVVHAQTFKSHLIRQSENKYILMETQK